MNDDPNDDELLDDGSTDDDDATDRIVLRASATKWVWVLIGSLVFTSLGLGLALGARSGAFAIAMGIVIAAVFVFCAAVAIRQINDPGALIITAETIQLTSRGRTTTFALRDCSPFAMWRNPSRGSVSVVFDYAPDPDNELNRENRRLMGGSRAIIGNYGTTPMALADLLNRARDSRRNP